MEKGTWKRQVGAEKEPAITPQLFAGERVIGVIEASLWDLGLLGLLLRRKDRLVVTTHRLLQYSTNFMSANLRCLELTKVESIHVGSKFNPAQFMAGVLLFLGAINLLNHAISHAQTPSLWIVGSLLGALAGLLALMGSEKKVLQASGAGAQNSVMLPLSRLGVNESKSFVDLVSGAIRSLTSSRRELARASNHSANGTESHHRPSQTFKSPLKPSSPEKDSLNGEDTQKTRDGWIPPSVRARRGGYIE
jgi:hypothetical protein